MIKGYKKIISILYDNEDVVDKMQKGMAVMGYNSSLAHIDRHLTNTSKL